MRNPVLSLVLLLLLATPAAAVEVQLGWDSEIEYHSQVLESDDVIFNFGPALEITHEGRRLSYRLNQVTTYEKYLNHPGLDDFRIGLNGSARYAISPHLQLDVSNRFTQTPLLRSGERLETDEEIAAAAARGDVLEATFEGDTGKLLGNTFSTGLTFSPTERLSLSSRVIHLYRNFDNESQTAQDTSSVSVSGQGVYRVFKDHQLGSGFRFSQRDFEGSGLSGQENRTTTYNAFAVWNWDIDERSTFGLTVGPAWSDDDQAEPVFPRYPTIPGRPSFLPNPATCPLLLAGNGAPVIIGGFPVAFVDPRCEPIDQPPLTAMQQARLAEIDAGLVDTRGEPEDQTDVNVFFTLSLDRNWDRLSVLAQWSRSDSQTQSLGSSTLVDTFYLQSSYWLTRRLRLSGTFRFTRRETDFNREVLVPLVPVGLGPIPELPGFQGAPVIGAAPLQQDFQQTNDAYTTQLRLTRLWGRHSSLYAQTSYRRGETDFQVNGIGASSSVDQWQVQFGFVYRLDPIRF
jgi:hypothetical protein